MITAVPATEPLSSTLLALSDRGAGVPLRELSLIHISEPTRPD